MGWSIVVPVKTTASGKSRLELPGADRPRIALAIALDTIAAAAAATRVDEVVVVTSDDDVQAGVAQFPGARWLEDPGMNLNGAVRLGLERAENASRAALLGDLPALTPEDLDRALELAGDVERGFVADEAALGTTLVTWRTPATFEPRFGAGSAEKHAEAGHALLDVPASSTLRHDVDTYDQLVQAEELGLGPRTRALLAASRAA
ncbi:2-phospho-L-lactate guanylyltransferase [Microbacterium excoecariae]|uniref:2-phospho-L-lactate guanylyltransferase n=1 Tax=Microbacterium excoecariae TaxID=2715210 RepID=UPI0014094890|nr:2-phospho-L-lactate guanylyltransferase [Microbacterium excoecariae]NHI15799.1 2-phospho-L-lactate guanylyltransferase [Microbacterium excoecariae]